MPALARRVLCSLLLLAAALQPFASQAQTPATLPPAVLKALADGGLPADALALVVGPVAPAGRHLAHRADVPLQPGSAMKLVTTLVGLEQLGPTWRGRSRLLAAGPVVAGVLQGDLVLQGRADADLDQAALQAMLQHARQRGLQEVRGSLVLDRSAFRPTRLDVGVSPIDDAGEFAYNLIPDALLVNENLLRVDLFVDESGLQARPLTPLAGVRVVPDMQLVDGDCSGWDQGWQPPLVRPPGAGRQLDVVLRGTWPVQCDRSVAVNVIERDDYIARLVRGLFTGMGGRWRGGVREGDTPAGARVLAEHQSRPLAELLRAINKPSDNALSRLLFLALGAAAPGSVDEPTVQRADRAVRQWMRQRGIDDAGAVFDNGSGLSRSERLSATQLEGVVRAGLASRWAPEFMSSLPIAGTDGTLRRRLVDSPAAGTARLKTGTLRNVVALAGTVPDASGQPKVVVAVLNHDSLRPSKARPVLDAIIDWVARTKFE